MINATRVYLMPCDLELANAITTNRQLAIKKLGVEIPEEWPLEDLKGFLPLYVKQLEASPDTLGWGIYLIIDKVDKKVIGDIGFIGKPNNEGVVEIGYSIIKDYRNKGYAYESARAIINWALVQNQVNKIVAVSEVENLPSNRVLEKIGMRKVKKESGLYKWELVT